MIAKIFSLLPEHFVNLLYILPPALFNLSLTASFVVLVVLFVRLLLRKAPRVYSYALWAVVAFRLICPVSFSSGFSLLGILNAPVAEGGQVEYIPIDIVHNPNPSVDLVIPEVTEVVNNQLPSPESQIYSEFLEAPAELTTWVWIAGAGIMLLWALISYFNLRQKLRTAVLLEGNVFQSEHVGSPFILGLLRPKIYIPFGLDETTLKYVLAHEKYHIKRLDHIVKVFAFAILTVHWFNPLCWLAFHLMNKDMEMSCDEKVLSKENNVRTEYSTVLLSFATNRRFPSPSPLAFGETGARSRIKNALNWKRPKVWVTVLAAAVCLVIIAACAANPKEEISIPDGSPYEWTSKAQADDLLSIRIRPLGSDVNYSANLSDEQCEELFDILNDIPSDSIYPGRGCPAQLSVTIVQHSQTVYLNYGGDVVEISLLVDSTDKIWEIHDDALNAFMADLLAYTQSVYDEYIDGKYSNAEGLSLSILSVSQQDSASTLTLKLENQSGKTVSYDRFWGVECLTDATWQDDPHAYTTELILLQNGESKEYSLTRELPPGTYHIWKQITLGTIDPLNILDEIEECTLSAVFTIGEASSQTPTANLVQWAFGTAFSSLYPGFPFEFTNFAYSHIEATCSAGQLVNQQTGEKGQSMTYHTFKQTLYWTPDSTNVPSAVIQFTAYDNETAVFSGSILIEQMEGDSLSSVYSARLSAGGELTLMKNITGNDGGLIYRIPVYDLTENGPIELGAHLLRNYHFKTNSTKIYFEFDPDIEPFKISLYSTDSETALSSFSLGGGNLSSFNVSGLSPDREYYFVAERQIYTLLTIHD